MDLCVRDRSPVEARRRVAVAGDPALCPIERAVTVCSSTAAAIAFWELLTDEIVSSSSFIPPVTSAEPSWMLATVAPTSPVA